MGFFGSGDKTQTSNDNRLGASDNAQLAAHGGFIFNGSSASPVAVTATKQTSLWLIAGVVLAIVAGFWLVNKK